MLMTQAAAMRPSVVRLRGGWHVVLRRVATMGVLATALAFVHVPYRPATVCPLRALTGIPCPFCGGTTAASDVGRLDLRGALLASPLAVIGAVVFALAPLGLGRWWAARPTRLRTVLLVAAALGSEIWQIGRFGLLH